MIGDTSLSNILTEQYQLSSKANVSLIESSNLPEFEREIFIDLIFKDLENINNNI